MDVENQITLNPVGLKVAGTPAATPNTKKGCALSDVKNILTVRPAGNLANKKNIKPSFSKTDANKDKVNNPLMKENKCEEVVTDYEFDLKFPKEDSEEDFYYDIIPKNLCLTGDDINNILGFPCKADVSQVPCSEGRFLEFDAESSYDFIDMARKLVDDNEERVEVEPLCFWEFECDNLVWG